MMQSMLYYDVRALKSSKAISGVISTDSAYFFLANSVFPFEKL